MSDALKQPYGPSGTQDSTSWLSSLSETQWYLVAICGACLFLLLAMWKRKASLRLRTLETAPDQYLGKPSYCVEMDARKACLRDRGDEYAGVPGPPMEPHVNVRQPEDLKGGVMGAPVSGRRFSVVRIGRLVFIAFGCGLAAWKLVFEAGWLGLFG